MQKVAKNSMDKLVLYKKLNPLKSLHMGDIKRCIKPKNRGICKSLKIAVFNTKYDYFTYLTKFRAIFARSLNSSVLAFKIRAFFTMCYTLTFKNTFKAKNEVSARL